MAIARAFLVFVLIACLAFPAGQEMQTAVPEPWRDWSRVSSITSGRKITVETRQPKRKVKGTFVSSDDAGITIRTRGGGYETISKESVRKVTTSRERLAYAPLVGAAAGAAVYAMAPSNDASAAGHMILAGMTAGIGALGGLAVWALGKTKLVYEAPKR